MKLEELLKELKEFLHKRHCGISTHKIHYNKYGRISVRLLIEGKIGEENEDQ